ncbi:MAG TPA: aminotransferase class I/II-fold pyridoxal phosphate-dependent enzyme [Chitinophagaceae bacterium]|nr:aminotransferase class I/II-fold pyridoxal phosphate-dependent enzyme [Chitinophagaceae bacterium]
MPTVNRRNFLKASGVAVLPAILPLTSIAAAEKEKDRSPADENVIKFFYDGEDYSPGMYINELQKINSKKPIEGDSYGSGGVVAAMEKKFEEITGKEKAIMMPTGTMSNQLAIAVLSGENTKVFVQDTSHVYRDEADAAQSVHEKRLMPLAMGETYFTAAQLKEAIESLRRLEVFASGVGVVSIENPVRRNQGKMVPLEEIKRISDYCRSNNIKLHLDGARLHIASAWSGVSIKEYSSYFDTVYISLYKYLGAAAGAVLCGDKPMIEKMPHLVKIHGGTLYNFWPGAAMVMSKLDGIESILKNVRQRSVEVFAGLNQIPGVKIMAIEGGTNIYDVEFGTDINTKQLQERLNKNFNIRIPGTNDKNRTRFTVNETLLYKDAAYVIDSFNKSLKG